MRRHPQMQARLFDARPHAMALQARGAVDFGSRPSCGGQRGIKMGTCVGAAGHSPNDSGFDGRRDRALIRAEAAELQSGHNVAQMTYRVLKIESHGAIVIGRPRDRWMFP